MLLFALGSLWVSEAKISEPADNSMFVVEFIMIFPLEDMAKFKGGMYGITVAASQRAFQLAKLAKEEDPGALELVEENDGKVVSLAARQLFGDEVHYQIESQTK